MDTPQPDTPAPELEPRGPVAWRDRFNGDDRPSPQGQGFYPVDLEETL